MYISIPDGLAVSCRNTQVYWYVNIFVFLFILKKKQKRAVNNVANVFPSSVFFILCTLLLFLKKNSK